MPTAAPRNISAHPISSTDLTVTWRPPQEEKQNGKIRFYNVSVFDKVTGEMSWYRTSDSTAHWTVPSLHPYQVYQVRVAAVTVGLGPFTEEVTVRMLEEGRYYC